MSSPPSRCLQRTSDRAMVEPSGGLALLDFLAFDLDSGASSQWRRPTGAAHSDPQRYGLLLASRSEVHGCRKTNRQLAVGVSFVLTQRRQFVSGCFRFTWDRKQLELSKSLPRNHLRNRSRAYRLVKRWFRGAFSSRELSRDPRVYARRRERELPAFRLFRRFGNNLGRGAPRREFSANWLRTLFRPLPGRFVPELSRSRLGRHVWVYDLVGFVRRESEWVQRSWSVRDERGC